MSFFKGWAFGIVRHEVLKAVRWMENGMDFFIRKQRSKAEIGGQWTEDRKLEP
jgi:hypothetical protein